MAADLTQVKQGEVESNTGRLVAALVFSSRDFIVFLDQEDEVWYWTTDRWRTSKEAWDLIGTLHSLSNDPLIGLTPEVRKDLRMQVASAIANAMQGRRPDPAVASRLTARFARAKANMARKWVVEAALGTTLLCCGLGAAGLTLVAWQGHADLVGLDIMTGALGGALGAAASLLYRAGDLLDDPAGATRAQYRLDGFARIAWGAVGAAFVAAAIKADLVLGIAMNSGHETELMFAMGFVAGISEKYVPGLAGRLAGEGAGDDAGDAQAPTAQTSEHSGTAVTKDPQPPIPAEPKNSSQNGTPAPDEASGSSPDRPPTPGQ